MEFKHTPIMLKQCIQGLDIKPDGIYVDGTLGGAGHSLEIVKKLSSAGKLIAIDKDADAIKASKQKLSEYKDKVIFVQDDFKNYQNILQKLQIEKVDGVLLDLGVSSYQIDNIDRGFSYINNAPLDMRMNKAQTLTAKQIINEYDESELIRILFKYAEEKYAKSIARKIINERKTKTIETTNELVEIIKSAVPPKVKFAGSHPAKKTFQAIRIEVNGELTKLDQTITQMIYSLNKNGRIAIISFHSLEDRIVKQVFKHHEKDCICPPEFPICICEHEKSIKIINKKPLTADSEEMANNTRSKSAKLRIAKKII